MKKQVLIISSSPRKHGNSDLLCDSFMKGAEEAGHEVSKIRLAEKKINYCSGCGLCYNGKKPCPQTDDMAAITEQMLQSDVIVLATPVYFYSLCAQMKTFIDRTVARYQELKGKSFYYIITAAEEDEASMERTIECFRGFLDCLEDVEERGIIYGTGAWQMGDIKNTHSIEQAHLMGATL